MTNLPQMLDLVLYGSMATETDVLLKPVLFLAQLSGNLPVRFENSGNITINKYASGTLICLQSKRLFQILFSTFYFQT
jgi:hypothetical protein